MTAEPADFDALVGNWPHSSRRSAATARVLRFPQTRKKVDERLVRLEWYLREYGRPPTWDELMALRMYKEFGPDHSPRFQRASLTLRTWMTFTVKTDRPADPK